MIKKLFSFIIFLPLFSFTQNKYDQLVEEGLELLKQQKLTLALDKYKQAYQIDSTRVEANYGLGSGYAYLCEKMHTNCDLALIYLNNSIRIDETYRNAHFNRGVLKNLTKNFKEAINDLNVAIMKKPSSIKYYLTRALSYSYLNDREKECDDLFHAASLGSKLAKEKIRQQQCK